MNKKILFLTIFITLLFTACGSGGGSGGAGFATTEEVSTISQGETQSNTVAITMPRLSGTDYIPTDELD